MDGLPIWFITDQNGELYRATEWGNVVVRLVGYSQAFADPVLWYPAASFGDTGAVSGAVAICMAVNAFARGYAPAQTVAILSSAEDPSRAAVLLKTAGIGC
jgi:3-oxoacyl-[acyl-carrier-protein] synthase-1